MRQPADVDEEKCSKFSAFFAFLRFTINNVNTILHNFSLPQKCSPFFSLRRKNSLYDPKQIHGMETIIISFSHLFIN
jgi:hypothetical protein